MQEIINSSKKRMDRSLAAFQAELAKVRTGRAHPSILDHVKVNCYDQEMPINQVASVNVEDARTLTITPWDKSLLPVIEKSLTTAELGLNPSTSGGVIRVFMPQLNEERRNELVRVVRAEAEGARVSVRNIRRDANNDVKEMLKDKVITEDDERRAQAQIQKLTDSMIEEIDRLLAAKEQELMTI